MDGAVTLLCLDSPGVPELNAMKIVAFLGGTVNVVNVGAEVAGRRDRLEPLLPKGGRILVSARTLAGLDRAEPGRMEWRQLFADSGAHVLVFGFEPGQETTRVLRELSSDSLAGVEAMPCSTGQISVVADCETLCRQLSGLRFDSAGSGSQYVFMERAGQGSCASILAFERKPFFARLNGRGKQWLLVACGKPADLDAPVPRDVPILRFFPALAPVLMFLHGSSRGEFWHNDIPGACLIVDDPLLKKRYGFLDYQKLLEVMDRKRFSTSIAFIPWNYRRSHRRVAGLLASRPREYSLCVHGCDHTRGEFGTTDTASLRSKARQALDRMQTHRQLTGVGFDDVMVFPQGIFSSTAMEALQACGYLAAVNTTPHPVDADCSLALRDLLQVAVTRFSNVPLFTRRYPQKPAELAFDLFLGKPAFVVEHHGFFRTGYGALGDIVDQLNRMEPRLEWNNPGTICSRACLKRTAADGTIHVQFFTSRFSIRNETKQPQEYLLARRSCAGEGQPAVVVNGRETHVSVEANCVTFGLRLRSGEAADIRVASRSPRPVVEPPGRNLLHGAKVFMRRSLSEFRDNYLDRNPFLRRAARGRSG